MGRGRGGKGTVTCKAARLAASESLRGCDAASLVRMPGDVSSRGPPYWKSRVLRRQVLGDEEGCGSKGGGDEAA